MDRIHTERGRVSHGTKNLPLIISLIVCALFLVSFVTFIVLIDHAKPLKMDVTDASLTQFNITTTANDTLHYRNLALNITLRNPNKYFRIYYDDFLVVADYRNRTSFSMQIWVAEFHQPENNTTSLKVQLNDDNITDDDVADAGSPNYYHIVVKLHLPTTYKSISNWRGDEHWKSVFICYLKVPLKINGSQSANMTTSVFETTKCQSDHDQRL